MAHKCNTATCEQLIHTSLERCKACSGVETKAFVSADRQKIRGGIVDGKWESGNKRAARAGIADALGVLADIT